MNNTNKAASVGELQRELLRHLSDEGRVEGVSRQFSAIETNHERVSFVSELIEQYEIVPALINDEKNDEVSGKFRQKGNEMFKLKCKKEAIEFYTQSIATAEHAKEALSLSFANRSAVLFEMKMYQECLEDISRALENGYPEHLKQKILLRQENARNLKDTQKNFEYFLTPPSIDPSNASSNIQCGSNAIEIKFTEKLGRHVVAKRDIHPGEVLAIEKPFAQVLVDGLWTHCHHCLTLCYNLIPCLNCTRSLYCSNNCRSLAMEYHQYECPISAVKHALGLDKLKLIALRVALLAKKDYSLIWDDSSNEEGFYQSSRYKEIHDLVGNTDKRLVPDLFERSVAASLIFIVIKKYTGFFVGDDEFKEQSFKEVLLKNLQTGPCNFHEISELAANKDGIYSPEEIGTACYSFLSMLNHSCNPNVLRNCHGSKIVLRCLESIREGEQCFDNYAYHYAIMEKQERLKHLKGQYFFDCNCLACEEDWPLYSDLSLVKEGVYIPSTDLEDLQLGNRRTAEKVLEMHLSTLQEVEKYKPSKNLAELQEVIKQCFALMGNVRRSV